MLTVIVTRADLDSIKSNDWLTDNVRMLVHSPNCCD